MKRSWTILALLATLLAPALACQTLMGGLNPQPTLPPVIELPPEAPPDVETELPPLPEVTVPAVPTDLFGGEAPADIPVVDQTENLSGSESAVSYETSIPFDEVLAFYKEQMPANGWEEAEGWLSLGGTTILTYTKGDRAAAVTVTNAGEKTTVLVGITPK